VRPAHKKARRGDAERAARKPCAKALAPLVEMRRAANKARYAASTKGRATAARYAASAKGRARSARYNRSERGARRAIAYNRTTKGRARSERFERTEHRRQYKALGYIFGSPYKDLDVTAVLVENRNQPLFRNTQGLRFRTISVRCMCFKCRWRKAKGTSTRRIPIHRAMVSVAPSGREVDA